MNADDGRSRSEHLFFTVLSLVLLFVRLCTLFFFTVQTIRHVRLSVKKNGRTDKYTLGTFVCLNLSFLGFFIYDGIEIGI